MNRTIIVEFDDPEALRLLFELSRVIADVEMCAYPRATSGVGGGSGVESRPPKGDASAIRLLGAFKRDIRHLIEGTSKRPGMHSRVNALIARQSNRVEAPAETMGGVEVGAQRRIGKAALEAGIVAKAQRLGWTGNEN